MAVAGVRGAGAWRRSVLLLRKMRADVGRLLDAYVAKINSTLSDSQMAYKEQGVKDGLQSQQGGWAAADLLHLNQKVEKQGLDRDVNLDSVDGVPTASTEQWSEASDAERLRDNLKAYWAFEILLREILEEQKASLTPNDLDFHESIQSVLLQVSALAHQLEELMVILEHDVPAKEPEAPRDAPKRGLLEKKWRGMKVLQELAQWSVRSVRDLHQLSKPL